MAGMKFNADIDVDKIIKLRKEIDKLKKSLIEISKVPNSGAAIKQLESELSKETKKLEEYQNKYVQLKKIKDDIDSSDSTIKRVKEETQALQSTNKWIVANTEAVKETDRQIKQLKKDFSSLPDSEKTGNAGIGKLRQIQLLAAERRVEEEAVRQTIKVQKDKIVQSRAEEGSITALRKQLSLLIKDYDDLSRVNRKGDPGKGLLSQISNVQKELNEAEQASGRFQRSVGNYASAWNGLGFSVQQIARELPSLAVSANTFFLAISNNIPMMVDEITKARKEYANFKAELAAGNKDVKAVTPVWKQLASSLFSWQTALVVGLTLLSAYGKEIIGWTKNIFNAKEKAISTSKAMENINNALMKNDGNYGKNIVSLKKLSEEWNRLTNKKDRLQWIRDNKSEFDKLDISINNVFDAENAFVKNTSSIIESLKLRAQAAAAQSLAEDKYKESLIKRNEAELLQQKADYTRKKGTINATGYSQDTRFGTQKSASELVEERAKGFENEANIAKESAKAIEKNAEAYFDLAAAKEAEASATLKKANIEGAHKKIKDNTNSIIDQNEKISDLQRKQAIERKRREQDMENQLIQSRIDAMASGEEKLREQREFDNKKEIQDLERQKDDYINAELELQRKLFEEQEKLRAKEDSKYKKREFDPSIVKVDTSVIDKIIQNTRIRQEIDPLKEEAKAWNEYLAEYGNFQQKKAAINAEYNQKISETSIEAEKASLEKQKQSKLKEINFEELKSSINFADIFGDLDAQSTEAITKMRNKLKEIIEASAKELTPTDLKTLQDALSNIDLKITERNPFGELKQGINEYKTATDDVIKAQEDLNKVLQGGEVITGVYADENGKLHTKLLSIEQAERNLDTAQSNRQKTLSKLTKAANSIGQSGTDVVNAGNEIVGMLENFGVKVPEAVGKTLEGVGQIMSGLEKIDLTKPFSAITGAVSILAGVGNTIAGLFGFGGADYSRYEEMKNQYENLNAIWDELIDKKKEYIDMSYGPEAVKVGQEALDIANKSIESYRILGQQRLNSGASVGSHAIGKRMVKNTSDQDWIDIANAINMPVGAAKDFIGTGRMTGLFDLTAEQLEKLQEKAPVFWAKMDGDVQDYLNKIIEGQERIEDIQKQVKEQLTQTSFDNVRGSFLDTLMDMDSDAKDFADDFSNYMQKAIITNKLGSKYEKELQKWYDNFAIANNDKAGITQSEMDDLRKQWEDITSRGLEDRNKLAEIFGWSSSSTSQEVSKKGFATASQESIDELNGRFTALYESNLRLENVGSQQSASILELKGGLLSIDTTALGIRDIASESRDIIYNSYIELTGIHDDTTDMKKSLKSISSDISEVKRNTSGLSKR